MQELKMPISHPHAESNLRNRKAISMEFSTVCREIWPPEDGRRRKEGNKAMK